MPLMIYSKGTEEIAMKMVKEYRNKDVVIGIGGGRVIDKAKILAGNERCIAIPTTASGSCMTSHAVVWGREKKSVRTKKPIYRKYDGTIVLPKGVIRSTTLDALSHAVESYWSVKSTDESREYSKSAVDIINNSDRIEDLIHAGNLAGKAIEITGTNIVHSLSYPLTVNYGVSHGLACGVFLYPVLSYFDFNELKLKKIKVPKIKFDEELIIEQAMECDKVNEGIRKINRKDLENICSMILKI